MIEKAKVVEYEFPGTKQEVELSTHLEPVEHLGRVECLNVENHGCIIAKKFENVDWNNYYQQFPNKYFTYPSEIDVEIEKFKGRETLEIGGNCRVSTKYSYDPYVKHNKAINLVDLPHLKTLKYDLIVLKNSINYISEEFLDLLISLLNKNGKIIGNTFNGYGDKKWKITDNEVTVNRGDMIDHYLILEDSIVKHSFYNRDKEFYLKKGFAVTPYNNNSLLLNYENQS